MASQKTSQRERERDEARAARRERERALQVEAVEALRSSAGWQRWLRTRGRFRRYSLGNQLLIALQCPQATFVAGFRKWLELGYCVEKGSRALWIWAPCPPSKKQLAEWERSGANAAERPRTFFKLVAVFDRSQVSELPPPAQPADLEPPIERVAGEDFAALLVPLGELATTLGYSVGYEALREGVGGYIQPDAGRIVLRAGVDANASVRTLVHELAHALVRSERREGDPALAYEQEELVVESVTLTVCQQIGLDTLAFSIPYMTSWAQEAELSVLERCAGLVDRIASRLEDVLLAQEPAVAAAA